VAYKHDRTDHDPGHVRGNDLPSGELARVMTVAVFRRSVREAHLLAHSALRSTEASVGCRREVLAGFASPNCRDSRAALVRAINWLFLPLCGIIRTV
jgi:hypothetical protein